MNGYYELLAEFDIRAPAEDLAAAACLDSDYGALRDAAWAAEAAKERHAEAFRWAVLQGARQGADVAGHASQVQPRD